MKTTTTFIALLAAGIAHAWSPGVAPTMPMTGLNVDTQSRNDVISFYQNVYLASEGAAAKIQWNGDVVNCNPGSISQDFVNQVRRRVNYYRALAGVPAEIVMNDNSTVLTDSVFYTGANIPAPSTTKRDAAQRSALIVTRMDSLTHKPDEKSNQFCFTPQGGNGSEFGNIAIGLFGPAAIDGYIREDINNQAAGHRRWIFLDEATNFATGDIPATTGRRASNSLYVFQRSEELNPQTPQFVTWPNAGMFPRQHTTEFWSLSYPKADFKNATISVTKNGSPVAVDLINREVGFGHNSIVWQVPSILEEKLTDPDSTYEVTVDKIGGAASTKFTYQITFFNANHLATPATLTGPNTVAPGGSKNYTIGAVDIAEQYRLEIGRKSPLAATDVEGGEDATSSLIIPGPITGPHYQVRSTTYRRSGQRSLNIAFTDGQNTEQWVELNRVLLPKSGAKLNFYRRLSFMNAVTTFVVQYSTNDDGRWFDIPETAIAGTTLNTSPKETNTTFSGLLSYSLPNATIGQPTRIRLVLRKTGQPTDMIFVTNAAGSASGAFIDDISFTNTDWLSTRTITEIPKDSSFVTLNATTAGESLVAGASYTLRLQPRVGSLWMTSSNPLDVSVNSNMAPTLAAIPGPITISEDAETQVVALTGISAGEGEIQNVTITATSSNPALIPHPTVSYSSPSATGQLSFRPNPNLSGSATITVRVSDGQASNGITTRTFDVQILPENDAPSIAAIPNRIVNEDASTGAIAFTLQDIDSPLANLRVSAESSDPELVPSTAMTLAGTTARRSITIRPAANRWGTTTITLTVTDGAASSTRSFLLTVNPVNDLPTMDLPAPRVIPEDSPEQTIVLTGVSAGPHESEQPLTITVVSNKPAVIPNPVIEFNPSNQSATLTFTPLPDAFGLVTFTVTVRDGQATANTLVRKFTVNVTPVNDSPTVSRFEDLVINEDTRSAPLPLTIFDRETAGTSLRINRISSNLTLLPVTGIILSGSGNNRFITIAPALHQHGSSQVTIEVSDGLLTVRSTFTVTVESVNDAPTLAVVRNPAAINEDASAQTIPLLGIGTGASNEIQTLTITAVSSNPDLIPHPTVNYQSPNPTGSLVYTPVANAFGTATITVRVTDDARENNTIERSFLVTVRPVNDAPTVSPIQPINLTQSSSSGPIPFTVNDVDSPVANIRVTPASGNTALLANTGIVVGGAGADRTITITPIPNRTGQATVTLTVTDGSATIRPTFVVVVTAESAARMMMPLADTFSIAPSTSEGDDGLPYCIEYQPTSVTISYLAPTTIGEDEETQTIAIHLPQEEMSDQSCYRAEYSDDGESWFTDGVIQEKTTDGLTATAPRGDAANRLMRWKVTTAQP